MPAIFMKGHDTHGRLYHVRTINKGVFPFIKPNDYTRFHIIEKDGFARTSKGVVTSGTSPYLHTSSWFLSACNGVGAVETGLRNNMKAGVHNKALSKLHEQLTISSNFFEAWYERREVYTMIGQLGEELLDLAINFKHPKYWKKKFGLAKAPDTLPQAWLMYQFGIVPIIGTLDTALKGLGQPLKSTTFKATSGDSFSGKFGIGPVGSMLYYSGTYRKTLGCRVTPNPNPNVALTNIMGLSTPFSTAWAVAPWGWAVDYFVNVSEMLSNVELRHPGVSTSDWYQTEKYDVSWTGRRVDTYDQNKVEMGTNASGELVQRLLIGEPNFKLHFSYPSLGDNTFANLFAALALTMKGKNS